MARKKKPCEWCESEQFFHLGDDSTKNVRADVEIYPDNGVIAFCVQGLSDDGELNGVIAFCVQGLSDDGELTAEESLDIPLNFCPACGRKLGY